MFVRVRKTADEDILVNEFRIMGWILLIFLSMPIASLAERRGPHPLRRN